MGLKEAEDLLREYYPDMVNDPETVPYAVVEEIKKVVGFTEHELGMLRAAWDVVNDDDLPDHMMNLCGATEEQLRALEAKLGVDRPRD